MSLYKLGDVAACRRAACVLCAVHTTHMPLYDVVHLLVSELRQFTAAFKQIRRLLARRKYNYERNSTRV